MLIARCAPPPDMRCPGCPHRSKAKSTTTRSCHTHVPSMKTYRGGLTPLPCDCQIASSLRPDDGPNLDCPDWPLREDGYCIGQEDGSDSFPPGKSVGVQDSHNNHGDGECQRWYVLQGKCEVQRRTTRTATQGRCLIAKGKSK